MPRPHPGLISTLLLATAAAAHGAAAPTAADADHLLGQAVATLAINDPAWIDHELTQFGATAGANPSPLRTVMANALFATRSLRGIDLHRPAVVAWRDGPSPLLAIIPIADRRHFIDDFGAVPSEPLIRVSERDGTTVYTQNADRGLNEYRLLVQDDTAFLARTVDECRTLAAKTLRAHAGDAPLALSATGAWLRGSAAGLVTTPTAVETALRAIDAPMVQAFAALPGAIDQIRTFECSLGPGDQGAGWRVHTRIVAVGDGSLATWIGNQRNQASRLLPAVSGAHTVFTVHGGLVWSGELERVGIDLARNLGRKLGAERWTPAIDEAWMQRWQLIEQRGAFAAALDLSPRPAGGLEVVWKTVAEQPHAAEVAALERQLAGALDPAAAALPVSEIPIGQHLGAQRRFPVGSEEVVTVSVATEQHAVDLIAFGVADVPALTSELIAQVQASGRPEGTPAVLVLHLALDRIIAAALPKDESGSPPPTLPPVACECALKAGTQSDLSADLDLPVGQFAVLLRDSMLLQSTNIELEGESLREPRATAPDAGRTPTPAPAPRRR